MTEHFDPQAAYDALIEKALKTLESCSAEHGDAAMMKDGMARNFISLHIRQMREDMMRQLGVKVNLELINDRLDAWVESNTVVSKHNGPELTKAYMEAWLEVIRQFYDFDIVASRESMRRVLFTMGITAI